AVPIERVVPDLSRIVEQRTGLGGLDDRLEIGIGVLGVLDQAVEGLHVGGVVLAVVVVDRLFREPAGLESVWGERKIGQFNRHTLTFLPRPGWMQTPSGATGQNSTMRRRHRCPHARVLVAAIAVTGAATLAGCDDGDGLPTSASDDSTVTSDV